jgi:hypothetical protein
MLRYVILNSIVFCKSYLLALGCFASFVPTLVGCYVLRVRCHNPGTIDLCKSMLVVEEVACAREVGQRENKVVTKRLCYSQSMIAETGPVKTGYLHKKGKLLSGWQQRWFEATGHYLRYYKAENRESMLAAIDLLQVCVEVPNKTKHSGIFHLRYHESTISGIIILKAGTEWIAQDWVSVIFGKSICINFVE